jgi:amino acid permease
MSMRTNLQLLLFFAIIVNLKSFPIHPLVISTSNSPQHSTVELNRNKNFKKFHRHQIRAGGETLTVSDVPNTSPKRGGETTLVASTFNLAKSIIGAGILSFPGGIAFFSDQPSALIPSLVATVIFGLAGSYSFRAIGKVCKESNAKSFQEAWEKNVDVKTGKYITYAVTVMCFFVSAMYSLIIAESFSSLFESFHLPGVLTQRNNVLLLITALVLYPLCSLENMNALAPFSIVGLAGTLYTAIFMAIRYYDGSYAPGGAFFAQIVAKPSFNQRGNYKLNHLTFVLLSMLSTGYSAHFVGPLFYNELKDNSMDRFTKVTGVAYGLAIFFFMFIMTVGFLTFGGNSAGFILNSYANSDPLAVLARFSVGVGLSCGYPLIMSAVVNGVMDIRKLEGEDRQRNRGPITVGTLALVTALVVFIKDLGFVVGMTGALFACPMMFIVPSIMTIASIRSVARKVKKSLSLSQRIEIGANYGLISTGLVMTVIGVLVCVLRQMGKM